LFGWYNCAGCHSNGGGGMGPPLMDDKWIYGSAPENIFSTIVQGRPNGMPSFAGRIPTPQVWMLVAYVRSLSGLTPSAARGSRTDHMMMYPGSSSLQNAEHPLRSFKPGASEQP
jgi:cytochrome c oxidase cbb3-type subunit III